MSQSTVSETPECTWNPTDGACGRCGKGNSRTGKVSARNGSPKNGSRKSRNADGGVVVRPQARLNEKALAQPKQWPEPRKAIVSDLFCDCVPIALIRRVLTAMGEASQHVFQIVTSNSTRMMLLDHHLQWQPNIEVGVKVECKDDTYRIYQLRKTSAHVKIVCFEPLRESVGKLDLTGIDRVIVAGNSRPGARPLNPHWVREIREQCIAQNVEFVLKQAGDGSRISDPRPLYNRASDEMPEPLTAQDLELLAAAENTAVEPPLVPLAVPEQTVPGRIWAFLQSCPGLTVALLALMALLMLIQGLWIKPVPLASLLKETAVMVTMATFFSLAIRYITQRPSR